MKISEFIKELEIIKNECGDLDVYKTNGFERIKADVPFISFTKILNNGQSKPDFFSYRFDEKNMKGEKVCRI